MYEVLQVLKKRGLSHVEEVYDMDKQLRLVCDQKYSEICGSVKTGRKKGIRILNVRKKD